MYYRINEFLEDWLNETGKTAKVFPMIPEASKDIIVHPKVRALGRLAFHIPQIIVQIGVQTGLMHPPELPEEPLPVTMAETNSLYLSIHAQMGLAVKSQWQDDMLQGEVDLYGHKWKRGDVLSLLTHHEVHHRSQMIIIMRLAGLQVPGLYGPVREDWEQLGMPVAK